MGACIFKVDRSMPVSHAAILRGAADLAHTFLRTKTYVTIDKRGPFTFTDLSPEQIAVRLADHADTLLRTQKYVDVRPWRPNNPWSKAIATTFSHIPNVVFINTRKSFATPNYVGTLVHEFCHIAGFGHGEGRFSNYNQGSEPKLSSVPIWMAGAATRWAKP